MVVTEVEGLSEDEVEAEGWNLKPTSHFPLTPNFHQLTDNC